MFRRGAAAGIVAAAIVCAGCDSETAPGPSPGAGGGPLMVETFTGSIVVGGSAFYSFNVPVNGQVALTLLSLREGDADSSTVVSLGLGVPAGTTCVVANAVTTKAGLTPQLNQVVPPSIYCARITDLGQLTADAQFIINIVHPK